MTTPETIASVRTGFWPAIGSACYDAAAKSSVAIICGIALAIFSEMAYAVPFFVFGGVLFVTRLVIKLTEAYAGRPLASLSRMAETFVVPYRRVQVIALLVLLIVGAGRSALWAYNALAGTSGVVTGVTVETYQYQQRQQLNRNGL